MTYKAPFGILVHVFQNKVRERERVRKEIVFGDGRDAEMQTQLERKKKKKKVRASSTNGDGRVSPTPHTHTHTLFLRDRHVCNCASRAVETTTTLTTTKETAKGGGHHVSTISDGPYRPLSLSSPIVQRVGLTKRRMAHPSFEAIVTQQDLRPATK